MGKQETAGRVVEGVESEGQFVCYVVGAGPEVQDQAVVVSLEAKLCHVLPGSRGHLVHT